jgi:hypothetical protein
VRQIRFKCGLLLRQRVAEISHGIWVVNRPETKRLTSLTKFALQIEAVIREAAVFDSGFVWPAPSFQALLNCVVECLILPAFVFVGVDRAPDKCCKVEARVDVLDNVAPLMQVRLTISLQVAQQQPREQLVELVPEFGGDLAGPHGVLQAELRPLSQIGVAPLCHVGVKMLHRQAHKVLRRNQTHVLFSRIQILGDYGERDQALVQVQLY